MEELYYQFVPVAVRNDTIQEAIFVDSGFKGTLTILLSSLVLIHDIERSQENVGVALNHMRRSADSVLASNLRSRIFLYAADSPLQRAIPNAGFDRWGHGGVHFLESLPRLGNFRGLDWRGRPQLVQTNAIQQHLGDVIASGLVEYKENYSRISRVESVPDLFDQVFSDIPDDESRVIFYIDLDNVVVRPVGYMGSETWVGDCFSAVPDYRKDLRKSLYEEVQATKRRLEQSNAYEIVINPWDLRREFEVRFPGRNYRVIGLTNRPQNTDLEGTMSVFDHLRIRGAFDEFSFSTDWELRKVNRLGIRAR